MIVKDFLILKTQDAILSLSAFLCDVRLHENFLA